MLEVTAERQLFMMLLVMVLQISLRFLMMLEQILRG